MVGGKPGSHAGKESSEEDEVRRLEEQLASAKRRAEKKAEKARKEAADKAAADAKAAQELADARAAEKAAKEEAARAKQEAAHAAQQVKVAQAAARAENAAAAVRESADQTDASAVQAVATVKPAVSVEEEILEQGGPGLVERPKLPPLVVKLPSMKVTKPPPVAARPSFGKSTLGTKPPTKAGAATKPPLTTAASTQPPTTAVAATGGTKRKRGERKIAPPGTSAEPYYRTHLATPLGRRRAGVEVGHKVRRRFWLLRIRQTRSCWSRRVGPKRRRRRTQPRRW